MEFSRTREATHKVVSFFHAYYDVNLEDPIEPFVAEAVFRLYDEQYFLTKKLTLTEAESNEFVYFADGGELLTLKEYEKLDNIAWEDGLKRAKPRPNHRNTDVTLVIVTEKIDDDCISAIKKAKHHVSYKFSFHGWSTYRVVCYELSKKRVLYNRRGEELKKVFGNIDVF